MERLILEKKCNTVGELYMALGELMHDPAFVSLEDAERSILSSVCSVRSVSMSAD